jgi:hypothetical protein
MPVHHFMIEDLLGALKAVALFPLFLLVPGYVAAWLLNVFDFRRRGMAFRLALAIPLSISICPILTYLGFRFASAAAVWAGYGVAVVVFLLLALMDRRRWRVSLGRQSFAIAGILAVWLAVCLFSLVDLQIGDRLYYPTSALDYSVRTAFVSSISTTGVPPQNPFFQPGHPVTLRYHYFWLMMCSLANQAGGSAISPRQALIGGTFWAGVGLMSLLAIYLRIFMVQTGEAFRRHTFTGILLLAITGLDIVPSLFLLFLYARGKMSFVLPSVEWWNEHVDWFLYSALWAPHALTATIACFTAFLLLWNAPTWRRYTLPAALALATSVGTSIYVAFVFAIFLAVWTLVTLWKKWYRETAVFCAAGVMSLLLALPYLHDLSGPGPGVGAGASGPLFRFTVREFSLAALVPTGQALSQTWRRILVNGTLLPLNYLLEFGLFFLIAHYKWRQHRAAGRPLSRQDLAFTVMLATSALVCTFLRSTAGCNDLGWRGFLVAEFVLLLWAADLFADRARLDFLTAHQKQMLVVFFALGFAGTVYDLAMVRFYPVLADRGVVPPLDWMSPDRNFGKRTYAERSAYQWLHTVTVATAAVQSNPKVVFQDTVGMIYGDRHSIAADTFCLTSFGGDPAQCPPVLSRVLAAFPEDARSLPASFQDICRSLPIDTLVAKDTDPVWGNLTSWVWTERPAYSNAYMRLFRCPSPDRTLTSSR